MDRLLDHARTGPFFLSQPEIANVVVSALRAGENRFRRYQLHSYAVMPNHVHVLELNPVTAGLALTAEQFPWSSAFRGGDAA